MNLREALDLIHFLRRVLTWIADPSYVGNFSPEQVVAIHRQWAEKALASPAGPQPAEPLDERMEYRDLTPDERKQIRQHLRDAS